MPLTVGKPVKAEAMISPQTPQVGGNSAVALEEAPRKYERAARRERKSTLSLQITVAGAGWREAAR